MNRLTLKVFGFTQSNLFRLQCLNDIYRTENCLRHFTGINSFSTNSVCNANPKPKSDQTDLVEARKSVYSELTVGEKGKQYYTQYITSTPCRVGSVGSVSTSHTVGREFASRPGHTKDHHKNGTNCLPA